VAVPLGIIQVVAAPLVAGTTPVASAVGTTTAVAYTTIVVDTTAVVVVVVPAAEAAVALAAVCTMQAEGANRVETTMAAAEVPAVVACITAEAQVCIVAEAGLRAADAAMELAVAALSMQAGAAGGELSRRVRSVSGFVQGQGNTKCWSGGAWFAEQHGKRA